MTNTNTTARILPGYVVTGTYYGTDIIGRVSSMTTVKIGRRWQSNAVVTRDDGQSFLMATSDLAVIQECAVEYAFSGAGTCTAVLA